MGRRTNEARRGRTAAVLVAALGLLVALLAPAVPAGAAASTGPGSGAGEATPSGSGTPGGPVVSQEVTDAVADGGTAFVIANLAAPTNAPEAVASTAQSVLDGLPDGTYRGEAQAQDLPFVALLADAAAVDALAQDPAVTSVVLDHVNTASLVNSVPAIGGDVARVGGYDGSGYSIAVIDTGVQSSHPFLSDGQGHSRVVAEACFSGAGGTYGLNALPVCPDGTAYQQFGPGASAPCNHLTGNLYPLPCGHGTHVAGIAAGGLVTNNGTTAPKYGVAPKASIVSVSVFSLLCTGTVDPVLGTCSNGFKYGALDSDIALALNWVNNQRTTYDVASVNLSIGGGTHYSSTCDASTILDTPIAALRANGIGTAVASGNEYSKTGISAPACVSGAVSVGSWDVGTNQVSAFSNSAPILTLLAPGDRNGQGILSSLPSATPPYSIYGGAKGTSMAAPHVAGALALLRQLRPGSTVDQQVAALTSTGVGVTDTNSVTTPRIRIDQALASVATVPAAPRSVTLAGAEGQITASWQPAASGGSAVTSYTATFNPGGATCTWTSGPLGCTVSGLTNSTTYSVSVHAHNAIGDGPESAPASTAPSTPYQPVVPARYLDTRNPGGATFDATSQGAGAVPKGGTVELQVTGRTDGVTTPVPASGVAAVAVNITVVNPASAGFLTVYPTGAPKPLASNLNFVGGQTIANMAVVQVGAGGRISIANSQFSSTDVLVDVVGWYPTAALYDPVVPTRYMDTRNPGGVTFDSQASAGGAICGSRDLPITGRTSGGVTPVPASGVASVFMNVTVVNPTLDAYATVFPTGATKPLASNLNYAKGQTIANMVVAKVGAGGKVTVDVPYGCADVIVDVVGWAPTGGGMAPLVPARIMDTRPGATTVDQLFQATGALAPNEARTLGVAGRGGVPAMGASAVVLNVTVAGSTNGGYLTVYPTGVSAPNASNVNFTTGLVIPNMVIAKVGADGQITLKNSNFGSTPVIVDVVGWYP